MLNQKGIQYNKCQLNIMLHACMGSEMHIIIITIRGRISAV